MDGLARAVRRARRRRADRPVEAARRPASDALGDAAGGPRSARRRRRGPSGGARRVRRDRAGRDPRGRPRPAARSRAEADPVEADQPVPVERPRPRVRRCPDDVAAERLDKAIRQGRATCSSTSTLFDVYRGDRVPDGTRSLAYRLRLQARRPQPHRRRRRRRAARGRGGGDEARGRAAKLTPVSSPTDETDLGCPRRDRSRRDARHAVGASTSRRLHLRRASTVRHARLLADGPRHGRRGRVDDARRCRSSRRTRAGLPVVIELAWLTLDGPLEPRGRRAHRGGERPPRRTRHRLQRARRLPPRPSARAGRPGRRRDRRR